MIYIGDDWAEDHHDIHIMDDQAADWPRSGYRRGWKE